MEYHRAQLGWDKQAKAQLWLRPNSLIAERGDRPAKLAQSHRDELGKKNQLDISWFFIP